MAEASACSVVSSALRGTKGNMLSGAAQLAETPHGQPTILHLNTLLNFFNQLLFCDLALSF